jgi:hypothetical protein
MESYDPHDDSFIAKNLDLEEWVEYQRDEQILTIVGDITKAFEAGLIAKIDNSELKKLGFLIACKAGTFAPLISMRHHDHWAAMALCMMSHGRMEVYKEEDVTRFSRSLHDNPPMYYDNIYYVPCPGKSWIMAIRKKDEDETEPRKTREIKRDTQAQADLFEF